MYANGMQSERLEEISKIKHHVMTNPELLDTLTRWREILKEDDVWHRRLTVFLSKMIEEAIDSNPELVTMQNKLQNNLNQNTVVVNGKEYNLGTIHSAVMESPNRELREKLFNEAKQIGAKNEDLFRTLIRKRNSLARSAGYQTYYHFKLQQKEINFDTYITEMQNLLDLSKHVSQHWNDKIKSKFGLETIHHYDQYFSTFNYNHVQSGAFHGERMKDVLTDVAHSVGVDLKQIPISIEQLEIPYGGFCININPENIKLVVNKRNAYSAFLSGIHELGHAIDGHFSSIEYPELYRFYSSIAAEGVAELFQTIVADKDFLTKNFHVSNETVEQIEEINELTTINMVKINYFYSLVEYELYQNPERSFQEVANDCYEKVFGYYGEAFHPASEMFYVENPAFFQDYNYSLAIRDMIRAKFEISSLYNKPEVFQRLIDTYIKPNQLLTWQERVEKLCGEPHTFRYLADRLTT
jgi:oligoendopeptidase F